jgi:serine/threonine-protein kinase
MNLEIGSVVGDYQITGVLGEGGMGKVFKVRNTISDRTDAMKVLLPDLVSEPELADRFLREIKVLASLNHPNIAGLRTALRFENQLLMIMEMVEGVRLDQRLRQGGRLPVEEAVRYISQALAALACAHERGIVHRDIKPANMMVMPDGTLKLMDFGIAKTAADTKLTMTGTTLGSLYYMSPEQIMGNQPLDARADLYSVGVSLYELVTGRRPFDGDSQFAIMSAHLEKTPVPPVTIDPSLPQALNDLILLSVQREPGARFQSADAFRKALDSVLSMSGISSEPTITMPPPAARAGSHRALWATLGALCCVIVVAGGIAFWPSKKTSAKDTVATPPVSSSIPSANTTPVDTTPPPVATQTPAPTPVPGEQQPTSLASAPSTPPQKPARNTSAPTTAAIPSHKPQSPLQQPQPQPSALLTGTPAQPTQATQAPPPVDAAAIARRAELQKATESLAGLTARATSVHSTLQNLQRQQAASGLGLRGDWVTSASLMDSFFRGAHDAISAGDAAGARDLMDKGERQLEKLEKALNK